MKPTHLISAFFQSQYCSRLKQCDHYYYAATSFLLYFFNGYFGYLGWSILDYLNQAVVINIIVQYRPLQKAWEIIKVFNNFLVYKSNLFHFPFHTIWSDDTLLFSGSILGYYHDDLSWLWRYISHHMVWKVGRFR